MKPILSRRSRVSPASPREDVTTPSSNYFSRGREIHRSGQIQQRGFAAAASSHQRHKLAARNVQGHVLQRGHGGPVREVLFADVLQPEDAHTSSVVRIGCAWSLGRLGYY